MVAVSPFFFLHASGLPDGKRRIGAPGYLIRALRDVALDEADAGIWMEADQAPASYVPSRGAGGSSYLVALMIAAALVVVWAGLRSL